ncbi:6-bladed beta-propeller [Pseudomonadota bacterium]
MKNGVSKVTVLRWLLLTMVMIAPCVGLQAAEEQPAQEGIIDLAWPPKPMPTRIRYLNTIASFDDLKREKGFWEKFLELIRGEEQNNQLKPMAVAVDGQGRMSVADPTAKLVHVYDQKSGDYWVIEEAGDFPLVLPVGLAVDEKSNIYVSDGGLKKICVFSPKGEYLRSIGGSGQIERPTSIAIDVSRRLLYVVDTPAHVIKVFNVDDGSFIRTIGKRGRKEGELNFPGYVFIGPKGRIHVNDALNGRIQVFDHRGKFIDTFGRFGDVTGTFATPKGVAVDSDGNIYVADAGFDNIQIFNSQGRLLLYFGRPGQAPGEFWTPSGLYIDGKDRLYVADAYNRRVQIFQYVKKAVKQ